MWMSSQKRKRSDDPANTATLAKNASATSVGPATARTDGRCVPTGLTSIAETVLSSSCGEDPRRARVDHDRRAPVYDQDVTKSAEVERWFASTKAPSEGALRRVRDIILAADPSMR